MKKINLILNLFIAFLMIFLNNQGYADSRLDDLDLAPEGPHRGQMLIGFFIHAGQPMGGLVSAEEDFLAGNTYTFSESGTIKELKIDHLSLAAGLDFEYMFIDHIGTRLRFKRTMVMQRTLFGAEYENWSKELYSDYSFFLGPSFHLSNRKKWDLACTPMLGYAIARVSPTPIAKELIDSYSGTGTKKINTICYGVEICGTYYFSSGIYFSLGADWTSIPIDYGEDLNLSQGSNTYLNGSSSTELQILSLYISAGYAFSH